MKWCSESETQIHVCFQTYVLNIVAYVLVVAYPCMFSHHFVPTDKLMQQMCIRHLIQTHKTTSFTPCSQNDSILHTSSTQVQTDAYYTEVQNDSNIILHAQPISQASNNCRRWSSNCLCLLLLLWSLLLLRSLLLLW